MPLASSASDAPGSMPAAIPQHTPSADGVSIAWQQLGHGDTAIVLIHGWAVDSTIWRAQLPVLSVRNTVVTLDLAGAGASAADRKRWSLALFAHDVASVVQQLPHPHIILVGQGMGGPVALLAAPLIGSRLQGVIGVETFRSVGAGPPLPSHTEHALQPFRADFANAMRQFVTTTLFARRANADIVRAEVDAMSHATPERAVEALAELNQFDYGPILGLVKVPIIAIDSDLGGAVDEARVHRAAPNLRIITLSGADSFLMLDDARRFNATLMQAVDSLAMR